MIFLNNDITRMLGINKQRENKKTLQNISPEGITVILERWRFPDGVLMTEKKNSLFCLFTFAVQSIKNTSGYFMVS